MSNRWLGFVIEQAPQMGFALKQVVIREDGTPDMEPIMYRSSLAEINQYRLAVEQQTFGEASWFPSAILPVPQRAIAPQASQPAPEPPAEEPFEMPAGITPNHHQEVDHSLVNRMTGAFMKNGRTNSFVALAFCTAVGLSFGLRGLVA